ncbi:MAG TPA: serine/threonine protein kinase [Planctomycetaceae bacterium]|nr:serine/threonine protein kinase [Planctomycetaceae bacterium]
MYTVSWVQTDTISLRRNAHPGWEHVPVKESERTDFQTCALASGLLTKDQLDEARAKLSWSWTEDSPTERVRAERQLADKLVELGSLNPWQAKQLLQGQFNFVLGPYKIVDSLGRGGMGHVYLAEHAVLGRKAALKVLPPERSTPETIENFIREIRAQASLNHENLVQAYHAGHDRNVYYLVAEYVPGSDLRKLARRTGPMDMQTAASIISQVAKGLEYAHQQGLIHRDVKPGNVLVTPDGHAKLSDLGLAGSMIADPRTDPHYGKIVGTADYLSPDQVRTPWAPTPAWDVYSLGCTLYFAVTSKVPFPGGTTADKVRAHCQVRPLDPRRLNPTLSAEFVDVIADMMAKDPGDRIDTAAEVVTRLAPWVGEPRPIPQARNGHGPAQAKIFMHEPGCQAEPDDLRDPGDTQDVFPDIDISSADSRDETSQQSQITRPIASADQDTRVSLPIDHRPTVDRGDAGAPLAPLLVLIGLPLGIVLLLAGILWFAGLIPPG